MPCGVEADRPALGEKEVVVDHNRAVLHFQEQIAKAVVVVEQVATDAGALGHPVQPDAGHIAAAVDVVAADERVDRAVELDAGHFRAAEKALHVDVVDVVAGDGAERTSHAAHDAGLFAMVDVVVADDVAADGGAVPAVFQGPPNALGVCVGGAGRVGIVELVAVLAQRHARAARVADVVVLDDPALAPVGGDEADLPGRGRRPVGGRVAEHETPQRNVVDSDLFRREDRFADVDLHMGRFVVVRVDSGELRPNRGVVFVDLGEPHRLLSGGLQCFVHLRRFAQPVAVEIDAAGMVLALHGIEPVAVDQIAVGIELAEELVGQRQFPGVAGDFLPAFGRLGAGDDDRFALRPGR